MALPLAAAAIPAFVGMAGGMMGASAASGQRSSADAAYRAALAQIAGIDIPNITEQELQYILPELMGEYAPEMEQVVEVGPSAMEGVAVDPRLKEFQMAALQDLSQRSEEGFSSEDQAGLDIARRQAAGEAQARQQAILQNLAARGMGGSGQELMARMQSSQQSANSLADQMQREMLAKQQARQMAAQQAGQLGGQLRTQEFGEQSDVARAKDVINQMRTQLQSGTRQRNVANQNLAAQQNLAEKQRIADQQNQLQNIQQERNKALLQQKYQNEMQKGQAMAGMYAGQADRGYQAAGDVAKSWSNIGGGLGQGIGGLMGG